MVVDAFDDASHVDWSFAMTGHGLERSAARLGSVGFIDGSDGRVPRQAEEERLRTDTERQQSDGQHDADGKEKPALWGYQ